jgi:16S rRNA (guanine966-N2)-methyltransferase
MGKTLHKPPNEFRVIAGQWRGRTLSLQGSHELRPTPNRVRETLFNWLGQDMRGARCLDLFAGSGALGIEALSRGAESCDFVELDKSSARQIRTNLETLKVPTSHYTVTAKPAIEFLKMITPGQYDLIFLDPPFNQNMIESLVRQLEPIALTPCFIYLEIEKKSQLPELPENWTLFREKTAGQVRYHLVLVE